MDSATEAPGELEDQVREDATPGVAEREQGSDPEAGAPALLQSESALSAADIIQAAIRNQTNRDDEHQSPNSANNLDDLDFNDLGDEGNGGNDAARGGDEVRTFSLPCKKCFGKIGRNHPEGHECVMQKANNSYRCTYCAEQHHKCVPMAPFLHATVMKFMTFVPLMRNGRMSRAEFANHYKNVKTEILGLKKKHQQEDMDMGFAVDQLSSIEIARLHLKASFTTNKLLKDGNELAARNNVLLEKLCVSHGVELGNEPAAQEITTPGKRRRGSGGSTAGAKRGKSST